MALGATTITATSGLISGLNFGPGVSSRNVDVTVNPGPANEADEFFVLQLLTSSVNAKIADVFASGNISAGA